MDRGEGVYSAYPHPRLARTPLRKARPLERLQDRTRPLTTGGAGGAQALQRGAGLLEFGDPSLKRRKALAGEFADTGAVLGAVEIQQFADLLESEAGRLRAADEAESPNILGTVAANPAGTGRHGKQAAPLIVAHGLDPDPGRGAEAGDRQIPFPFLSRGIFHA